MCGLIGINTRRIDLWRNASFEQKAQLINTMAHEMTHLILIPNGTCDKPSDGLYTDQGHLQCKKNGVACNDAFLVSYTWGDLVQCAYLAKIKGEALDLHSCLLNTVNGGSLDRASLKRKMDASPECKNILDWR